MKNDLACDLYIAVLLYECSVSGDEHRIVYINGDYTKDIVDYKRSLRHGYFIREKLNGIRYKWNYENGICLYRNK